MEFLQSHQSLVGLLFLHYGNFLLIPSFVILSFIPALLQLQKWRRSLTALIETLEPTYYLEFLYIQGSMTSGGSVPESLNSSNQATPVKIIPPTPHRKLRAKSQGGKQWYFARIYEEG